MTPSRSTARVFSGVLSHLMVNDVMAAGLLTHTHRSTVRDTPIRITADVLSTLDTLSEGPVALYGDLQDGVLVVLGPDLRRRTLAAQRPRGEMGPPAPQTISVEIVTLVSHISRATQKPYLKGTLRLSDDTIKTFLVRDQDLVTAIGESYPGDKAFSIDLRVVIMGDLVEVIGVAEPEMKPVKRALSREQKDAKNARARELRAAKKTATSV